MKSPHMVSVGVAMATKCSSGVTMTTDSPSVHMRSHRGHRNAYANHRKSAVELLAASKAEYVKSTQVLNHKQELKHPENLSVGNRELLSLSLSPSQNLSLDDETNHLTENNNNNRKSSGDSFSTPSKTVPLDHNHPNHLSHNNTPSKNDENSTAVHTSTGSPLPSSSLTSHSSSSNADENRSTFKKPVTPPKIPPKPVPVVPPRPASAVKPTTPPKPAPRTTSQLNPITPGTPVPPPRPSHKPRSIKEAVAAEATDPPLAKMSVTSSDKHVVNCNSPGATNSSTSGASPELITKRFSSLSAHATIAVPKLLNDQEEKVQMTSSASSKSRETRNSLSSQSDSLLKPLCTSALSTSVGVLVEKKRCPVPKPRVDKQLDQGEVPPRRQLHRSHSDLSSCRHSRTSSDFSDLSSRLSRTSTEVERFFNEMGIDRIVLEPMRKLAETKQKDFLDSLSSLDSQDGHSLSSRLSQNDLNQVPMESEQDLMERSTASGTTSIVERNARIIKWLCNVKKARTAPSKQSKPVSGKS